ncbi:MAG: F0F1 ATP synthase subunit B [Patescibacteria group bacterium]|jgi:F-type H+-transporting ATPase subunit b
MEALGIDLKLIIAQIINFGLLFFLLSKFAYKPILKMLTDRQEKIQKGLSDADKAAKKLAETEKEATEIRDKAFKEADEILKNAKVAALAETSAIGDKAAEQAERTIKNAKAEADQVKANVMKDAKKEISDVVIIALDKIVGTEFTAEEKKKMTSKAISEL